MIHQLVEIARVPVLANGLDELEELFVARTGMTQPLGSLVPPVVERELDDLASSLDRPSPRQLPSSSETTAAQTPPAPHSA